MYLKINDRKVGSLNVYYDFFLKFYKKDELQKGHLSEGHDHAQTANIRQQPQSAAATVEEHSSKGFSRTVTVLKQLQKT